MRGRDGAAPSRVVVIGGGIFATAGLVAALYFNAASFTLPAWIVTAAASIAIAYVARQALPIRGLRMRRTGLNAEAVVLDCSIIAPLFALGGTVGVTAAALATACGYCSATLIGRSSMPTDILRHGVTRVIAVLALLPGTAYFAALRAMPAPYGPILFTAILTLAIMVYGLAISAPLSAITYRLAISRVWGRMLADPRTWIVAFGGVAWSVVIRDAMLHAQYVNAVAMWMPVCVSALLLKTIDHQHAELHRLRLVHDAVQAMLTDNDPLPQINAILSTLRVPSYNETVSVLVATSARTDAWRSITTLGPELSPAGDELRRRILARLKFSGRNYTTLRDTYYVAYAFAAQLSDNELHGALIVHRRNDRALTGEQIAQFTNAARELVPLLRDMRSIVAAQSAATTDALTGLSNRAATMDRLHAMLDELPRANAGAVLLLDIDHFKTINDELGHAAGDDCLRRIAEIVRGAVRSGDIAGRIGGEEFLIVMPSATRDIAITVAERLRVAVSLGGMRYAGGNPVTTSIGVAAARTGDTPESILARADAALYEAKHQGRNRVVEQAEESA